MKLIWNGDTAVQNGFTYIAHQDRTVIHHNEIVCQLGTSGGSQNRLKELAQLHANAITAALAQKDAQLKVALDALKLAKQYLNEAFDPPPQGHGEFLEQAIKQIEEGV